ncbi:hypothetical protein ABH15_06405 [Methanoculleus taiwanensis]|uniref:BioF2-like acetyltransferase domain-containing protein n=1 Tax=Methanoculleus taiwanensis TaxID=1550565 RepID=A0A498GYV6_9EURY|nr:GNAT family N-acetyltransferase [Methanoculleus taiwanensis]RXE55849.1 hypothetical protein ABH15_06405 [Methanoculleus taiwanensis]
MGYYLQELSAENTEDWEEFNNRCAEGTFFHNLKWKSVLESVLNADLKYWILQRDQKTVGIFPSRERRILFSKGLDTIPHSEYNNILLDDNVNPQDLGEAFSLFGSKYSFFSLSVRKQTLLDHIGYDHYPSGNTGNMILDLQQKPPDSIWENFPAKKGQRKFIRRFDEKGFTIHEIRRQEDIRTFYQYYAENLMRINGDLLPLIFFQKLLETFSPNEMRVTALAKGDIYAGGLLTFTHPARKTAYFQYLSLNRSLPNTYHPTYYLFWEGLNWAWSNGYEKISLGQQKLDPSNARFRIKADFGAEHVPMYPRVVLFSKATSLLYRMKKSLPGGKNPGTSHINRAS